MARWTMSMARSTPAQNPRGLASNTRTMHRLSWCAPPKIASCAGTPGGAALAPGVNQQQRRPDGDRGIRDVERRKIRAVPVCVNEVDHMAGTHTVDQITQRSAENERQAAAQQPLRAGLQSSQPGNDR